jgi:hypothetical protein
MGTWEECLEISRTLCGDENPEDSKARNIAIILIAFERVFDHLKDRVKADQYFKSMVHDFKNSENETVYTEDDEDIARHFAVV